MKENLPGKKTFKSYSLPFTSSALFFRHRGGLCSLPPPPPRAQSYLCEPADVLIVVVVVVQTEESRGMLNQVTMLIGGGCVLRVCLLVWRGFMFTLVCSWKSATKPGLTWGSKACNGSKDGKRDILLFTQQQNYCKWEVAGMLFVTIASFKINCITEEVTWISLK